MCGTECGTECGVWGALCTITMTDKCSSRKVALGTLSPQCSLSWGLGFSATCGFTRDDGLHGTLPGLEGTEGPREGLTPHGRTLDRM